MASRSNAAPKQQIRQFFDPKFPKMSSNPNRELTQMEADYVRYYVDDGMSKVAAARAAGYEHPTTMGSALAQRAKIAAAIKKRQAQYAAASQITKKKVVDGFLEAIEMAKLKGEPLVMVAGWREIGKLCGLYEATKHKVEVSVNGQVVLEKLNAMTDDELLKLAHEEIESDVVDVEAKEVDDETAE